MLNAKAFNLRIWLKKKLHIHCAGVHHFDSFMHFGWPWGVQMAFPAKVLSLNSAVDVACKWRRKV